MKFAIAGEGLTDFSVLQNLLRGYFNDKNLPVNRLLPKEKEPVGWGNLLNYIATEEFRDSLEFNDIAIVQIDTKECEDWKAGILNIADKKANVAEFIKKVTQFLIQQIGADFYNNNKDKILFAIAVHEIECWLLPFNSTVKAHLSKMVGCEGAIEKIANKRGFSIHQKNYGASKHYDELSQGMRNRKVLLESGVLNPSLAVFLDSLASISRKPIG